MPLEPPEHGRSPGCPGAHTATPGARGRGTPGPLTEHWLHPTATMPSSEEGGRVEDRGRERDEERRSERQRNGQEVRWEAIRRHRSTAEHLRSRAGGGGGLCLCLHVHMHVCVCVCLCLFVCGAGAGICMWGYVHVCWFSECVGVSMCVSEW